MPDDPDRSHDTDPLADTQTSEDPAASSLPSKRRNVGAGDTLGRYELVDDVGEGGMATVYRARDKELRREVAIKVLFPHLARRDDVVRRFHREARAAAGLEHANILRVYDVGPAGRSESDPLHPGGGETDDPPYIVMELIRGHSLLGEIERRGPMIAEVTACIGALLADALAVAHKAGIIHRDIKPANVMVAPGGRILLADFGVARLETEDSLVTKTGALLGTPAYMSPEQASGDTATSKSDLYSLGATLYQLATGQLPYAGSPAKVLALIAQGAYVSAVKKRTEVGPDLSRVIDRMMAVEPTARPASAIEVASELRAIVAAAGLGEPADELAAYFADPDAYVKQKTPSIVAGLVKAGDKAISEGKLPRAIAIADRASALAPEDPAVTALVATVTEGGRATQRRRVVAIAGIGVLVAGSATFGAMQLFGSSQPAVVQDGAAVAIADDAISVAQPLADGAPQLDAGDPLPLVDAGPARTRDGGPATVRRVDAGIDAVVAMITPVTPIDAAPAVVTPDAAPAANTGFIVVKTDAWCEVTIDNVPRGRANARTPIKVDAGTHTVVCEQTGLGKRWTKQVTVGPGATVDARGSLLGVAVTFEVDATVDGTLYRRGQVAQLGGRIEITVDGKSEWVSISIPCKVRSSPRIDCYP